MGGINRKSVVGDGNFLLCLSLNFQITFHRWSCGAKGKFR